MMRSELLDKVINKCGSIWIDIEGFSALWKDSDNNGSLALNGLNALISGFYAIGKQYTYENPILRIFAHQFGDGFLIVSDSNEESLARCASIAIALMRHVLNHGIVARAAISEGEAGDLSGCWPEEIRNAPKQGNDNYTIQIGAGIMTLLPIMGTAMINAYKLDGRNPAKGAILTIATEHSTRLHKVFCEKKFLVLENSPQ